MCIYDIPMYQIFKCKIKIYESTSFSWSERLSFAAYNLVNDLYFTLQGSS